MARAPGPEPLHLPAIVGPFVTLGLVYGVWYSYSVLLVASSFSWVVFYSQARFRPRPSGLLGGLLRTGEGRLDGPGVSTRSSSRSSAASTRGPPNASSQPA
ncbi:MAG: hypothetical protein ACREKS_03210 [Candidatus Rokuibacteriota bacterium]